MRARESTQYATRLRLSSADGDGQLEARALAALRLGESSVAARFSNSLTDYRESESSTALPRRKERLPDSFAHLARDTRAFSS